MIPPTLLTEANPDLPGRPDDAIHTPSAVITEPVAVVATEPFPVVPGTSVFEAPAPEVSPTRAATVPSAISGPRPPSQVPRWSKVLAAIALVCALLTLGLLFGARNEGKAKATTQTPTNGRTTVASSTTPAPTSLAAVAPVASGAALSESEPVAVPATPTNPTPVASSASTTTVATGTVTRTTVARAPTTTIVTTTTINAGPTTTATPSATTQTPASTRP